MTQLNDKYKKDLEEIKSGIQASQHLANYLEEEEDEFYDKLKDEWESNIEALHEKVALSDPLQLEALEEELLDGEYEGLFLPRVLGYSVLRGALNDQFKYIRPQEHFKKILMAICNSSNFDIIKNRIGQTIEVGFAHSSDIWITNLIAEVGSKQVTAFLQSLKLAKYSDQRSRHTAHVRYERQFKSFNFLTAELPATGAQVKIEYKSIVNFLLFRASLGHETSESVYDYIKGFVNNADLAKSDEHLEILLIIAFFFDLQKTHQKKLATGLDMYQSEGDAKVFETIKKMQELNYGLKDEDYDRIKMIAITSSHVELQKFIETTSKINEIGYINPDAAEVTKVYYDGNKGTSLQNSCLRNFIFAKCAKFMSQLQEADFAEYFELNKTFVVYMNIFDNEKFNQNIKGISLSYVKKLLRKFIDKRSKDYQDIKKFVTATFLDLGFMKEKEVKELFKTKRKKKEVA